MEETFISFVSSCFLDGDHDGHNNRTSEEEDEHVEEAGELLCDFVPYAHDGYIPLRDRAFSWDVTLENPIVDEHPHFSALLGTTTVKKEPEKPKLVLKTSKKSNNSQSSKIHSEENTKTSTDAKDFDDDRFLDDDTDIFDELGITEGLTIKKEILTDSVGEATPSGKSKRKTPLKQEKSTSKQTEVKQEKVRSNKKNSGNANSTSNAASSISSALPVSGSMTVTTVSSNIVSSGMTSGTLGTTLTLPVSQSTNTALLSGTIVTPVNHPGDMGRSESMQDLMALQNQQALKTGQKPLGMIPGSSVAATNPNQSMGQLLPNSGSMSSSIQVIPVNSNAGSSSLQYQSLQGTPGTSNGVLHPYSMSNHVNSSSMGQQSVISQSPSGASTQSMVHPQLQHYLPSSSSGHGHAHLTSFMHQQKGEVGNNNNSNNSNVMSSNSSSGSSGVTIIGGMKVEPVLPATPMTPGMMHHHHPHTSTTSVNGVSTTLLGVGGVGGGVGHPQNMYKPMMKSSLTSMINSYTSLTTPGVANGGGLPPGVSPGNGLNILSPSGNGSSMDDVYRLVGANGMGLNGNGLMSGAMGNNGQMVTDSERRVGQYTIEERRIKIEKFRERKRQRIWRKQIKYDCRKRLADNRPRVKGRFVSRKNLGSHGHDALGEDSSKTPATPGGDDGGIIIGEGSDNDSDGDVESANATMILGDNDMDVPPSMKRSKTCEF